VQKNDESVTLASNHVSGLVGSDFIIDKGIDEFLALRVNSEALENIFVLIQRTDVVDLEIHFSTISLQNLESLSRLK
jgi:hypothetical protein